MSNEATKPATNWDAEAWRRILMNHTGPLDDAELAELDYVFTYKAPRPDQVKAFAEVKTACVAAAAVLLEFCPPSADRTTAINHLRDARMRANAAIALDGRA